MGLVVIDPGLSTTVQDLGRPGYREWGMAPAGAFDRRSARLANALVGNSAEAAVLEFTLRGGAYRALAPLAVALAGAPMPARVVREIGRSIALSSPQSFHLQVGDCLEVGQALQGARAYLAVRGGWRVGELLGSASAEQRLEIGQVVAATPGHIASRRPREEFWRSPTSEPIRIIDGPDTQGLPDARAEFWQDRLFRVTARSNRIGLRLEGVTVPLPVIAERLSIPVGPGAIQVAGGQLIVLGIACGTMGGYPVIAHVISHDLDQIGQLRPGDKIRFARVSLEAARGLDHKFQSSFSGKIARIQTLAQDAGFSDG